MGSCRGVELGRRLRAQHTGVGPELLPLTIAELRAPERAAPVAELQPTLLRLAEQLRGFAAPGHPPGDTQRVVALGGFPEEPG